MTLLWQDINSLNKQNKIEWKMKRKLCWINFPIFKKRSKKETGSDLSKSSLNKTYKTSGTLVSKHSKKINVLTRQWNLNNRRRNWNSYKKWKRTNKLYWKKLEKPKKLKTILVDWFKFRKVYLEENSTIFM